MADTFQLNFASSESEEEEDDFWKNKKKSNKAIFSDSDSDTEKSAPELRPVITSNTTQDKTVIRREPVQSKLITGSLGNDAKISNSVSKRIAPTDEAPVKANIGTTFLHVNPVANKGLSPMTNDNLQSKATNDFFNSSITSTTSSTSYSSVHSVRSKNPEVDGNGLQPPVPRPKFTMPATVIQNASFNQAQSKGNVQIFKTFWWLILKDGIYNNLIPLFL